MKSNRLQPKIYLAAGVASMYEGRDKVAVTEIPYTDPECGCGTDCCLGYIVLPNRDSATGKIVSYIARYYIDGVAVEKPLEDAIIEITALNNL